MSNIFAVLTNLDPLAILFVVGSLAFLWVTLHVIVNDLDLEKPEESTEASSPTLADDAPGAREAVAAEGSLTPVPPTRPTGSGSRRAA